MMRLIYFFILFTISTAAFGQPNLPLHTADNPNYSYVGRIDFTNKQKPRFWAPGVYITARFKGTQCQLVINDEELYGDTHNYLHIVIDGKTATRIQTKAKENVITIASGLPDTEHTVLICKDTESGMGYLEFVGLRCQELLPARPKPVRRIEYIGDSITAGASSDPSQTPCDAGKWYDQHNAYMSYGAITSRSLNAQWQISAVAGIGLIHSCCDMKIVMPEVFDKMYMRNDSIPWNFSRYQPDVVTVCLGQNDGEQDSVKFRSAYIKLLTNIRSKYPKANIVCLSSPMAGGKLSAMLKRYIAAIVSGMRKSGDKKVSKFFFSRAFNSGCAQHPNVAEHEIIAAELRAYIKALKRW